MPTWFVSYKFKSSSGKWLVSNMYTVAETAEQAKTTVSQNLKESGVEFQIIGARIVGEGR